MNTTLVETRHKRNPGLRKPQGRVVRTRAGARKVVASAEPLPRDAAASAGLRYVTDQSPGVRRLRVGSGFHYVTAQGSTIRGNDLERIKALAIPPAWRDVWVYMDRTLAQTLSARAGARLAQSSKSLSRTETAVLALLQRRLRREAQRKSA